MSNAKAKGKTVKQGKPRKPRANVDAMQTAPAATAVSRRFGGDGVARGSRRVQMREYIGDIATSVSLVVSGFRINPGDTDVFPWLSTIAAQYESYRFHKLAFEYAPAAASTTAGRVILSPDYQASDDDNVSLASLLNTRDAVSGAYWENVRCEMNVAAMYAQGPRKQISSYEKPNQPATDVGVLRVGTTGAASVLQGGQLWVAYDVELFTPTTVAFVEFAGLNTVFARRFVTQALTSTVLATVAYDGVFGQIRGLSMDLASGVFTTARRMRLYCQARVNISSDASLGLLTTLNVAGVGVSVIASAGVVRTTAPAVAAAEALECITEWIIDNQVPGGTFQATVQVTGAGTLLLTGSTLAITLLD